MPNINRFSGTASVIGSFFCFAVGLIACRSVLPPGGSADGQAATGALNDRERTSAAVVPSKGPSFPAPQILGFIPVVIPPHDTSLSPEQSRPFFDAFSWQSFIALNWPAVASKRGVPDQPEASNRFLRATNGTPVVWGTYKTSDDIFGTGKARPAPWDDYGPGLGFPGNKVFTRLSKGAKNSVLSDTIEAFSFPLVDQNKAYVRYEVNYNKAFYNFVRGTDTNAQSWRYLLVNLAKFTNGVSMPASTAPTNVGALMLKAAWREMTPQDLASGRYYVVQAQVEDPISHIRASKPMGLVGLHITQKLQGFPEWNWSTFEQVDNVRRGPGSNPTTPISFNDGTSNPPTPRGYANRPASKNAVTNPVPVQVTRLNPIPMTPAGASTVEINAAFQKALAGTVWQYYELVMTQWPSDPTTFKLMENGGIYPADCGAAFPPNGACNTTMETYFQSATDAAGARGNSCMSCHYRAASADFSWGLMNRAH